MKSCLIVLHTSVLVVTPFTGVWIEMKAGVLPGSLGACHTLHGCVD